MNITVGLNGAIATIEVNDIHDAKEVYGAALDAGLNDNEAAEVVELVTAGDFFVDYDD